MKELSELTEDLARRTQTLIETAFVIRSLVDMIERKQKQRAEPWQGLVMEYLRDIKIKIEEELRK